MPTPHNTALKGQIAKTVLMPGDPKRSEFIAKNFLENAELINDVRGVHGYTGTWKGVPVTVMASGMGMPAIGIYSWELYEQYDVENIIRVGSAGALPDDIELMDIIIAQAACCQSDYVGRFNLPGIFSPIADYKLLSESVEAAKELGLKVRVGNVLSSDNFYIPFDGGNEENLKWKHMNVLGVEMESAALYANAAYFGKRALCILTVSDLMLREGNISTEARQTGFANMIKLALDTAVRMEK